MGRGPEQTFSKKTTFPLVISNTNHEGNANQNHSEISLHTCQDGHYKKDERKKSVGKDANKKELLDTIVGM